MEWNKKNCLIIAFVINIIFMIVVMSLSKLYYLTGDEFYFSTILSGAEGMGYEAYTAFQNIIWSHFISLLYKVLPGINWYVIVCVIISLLSMVAITYCFIKKGKNALGIIFSLVFFVAIGKYAYVEFAFTYNAYLYCIAGLFLIVDLKTEELKANKVQLMCGMILVFLGALVRERCFFSVILIFAVPLCIGALLEKKGLHILLIYIVYIVGICGVLVVGKGVYTESEEWSNYLDYNSARSQVVDYELPTYQENIDFYESIGVSEIKYKMIERWMLEDYDFFNIDILDKIREYRINNEKVASDKMINEILMNNFHESSLGYFVIGIFILFCVVGEKRFFLDALGIVSIFFAEYGYLIFVTKRVNFHATYGLWLSLLIIFMYLILEISKIDKYVRKGYLFVVVSVGCIWGVCCIPKWLDVLNNEPYRMDYSYQQIIDYMKDNQQNLYLGEMWTMDEISKQTNPSIVLERGDVSNLYITGGCYLRNPRTMQILDRYEIQNPIPALIEKSNVYLIAKYNVDLVAQYLMEKYATAVNYKEVERFDEVGIYQFYVDSSMQIVKSGEFYEDGWFGTKGKLNIYNCDSSEINIKINYIANSELDGAKLVISADGKEQAFDIFEGENTICINLNNEHEMIDLSINKYFVPKELGDSEDGRCLSINVKSIEIVGSTSD